MKKLFLIAAMIVAASSLIFWGCQKEASLSAEDIQKGVNTAPSVLSQFSLSVNEAQEWYETNKRKTANSLGREERMVNAITVTPDWKFATIVKYEGAKEMVVVPIQEKIDMFDLPQTSIYNLVIFKTDNNNLKSRLLFFVPSPDYVSAHPNTLSVKDFSGTTFQIDDSSRINSGWVLKNGAFLGALKIPKLGTNVNIGASGRGPDGWWTEFITWFLGEGCYGTGAWQHFTSWLSKLGDNVNFWVDFKYKPNHGNFDGSDGSNFGNFGPSSEFAGIFTTWTTSTTNSATNSTATGLKDFFGDGILGIKKVKSLYKEVCNPSTTDSDTPFLFTIENLRLVAKNDIEFQNVFAKTLDFYYQLKASGQNITFAQVVKEYIINPSKGINAPQNLTPLLPSLASNPSFKSTLNSIMQEAISQYNGCINSYGMQISSGNTPIEIPNDAACSCLGDFSVEDALDGIEGNQIMKSSKFIITNPCLSGKVDLNNTADEVIIKTLAQSGANLSAEENCKLFDILKKNPELLSEIENLLSGNLLDPCDKTPSDIMFKKALAFMTEGTLNDLDKALAKNYQTIVVSKSLEKCKIMECLIKKMINNDLTSSFLCQLLKQGKPPTNSSNIILRFSAVDFASNGLDPNGLALTKQSEANFGNNPIVIPILINTAKCEKSSKLDMIETIQHELIHADIRKRLLVEYNITSNADVAAAFKLLVTKVYGDNATVNDHHLMLKYYIDKMANSLRSMNGNLGVYEDYEGAVLNGFGGNMGFLIGCGYPISDVIAKYNRFLNFAALPANISPTINECQ
jgi:hypothetical protein